MIGIVCAFIVFVADLYFVMRFLLETEGNIKRPTSPEHSKTSSDKKTKNLVKNEDKSGVSDTTEPPVATKPKIE